MIRPGGVCIRLYLHMHIPSATALTWAYVKLFGCQLRSCVRDWNGLPNSHTLVSRCLVTKAQFVGVVVSIQHRAERVEFMIDDGTALVRAVLWTNLRAVDIALGDLIRVEGKLNTDTTQVLDDCGNGVISPRELRVQRISKIRDPNEEMLHWLHIRDLTSEFYHKESAFQKSRAQNHSPRDSSNNCDRATWASHLFLVDTTKSAQRVWDRVVNRVFHEQILDDKEVEAFKNRQDKSPHDEELVEFLEYLIQRQKSLVVDTQHNQRPEGLQAALRVCFPDVLRCKLAKENVANKVAAPHHPITRTLQSVFATLRSSGLLYLEDEEEDRYVFVTAEFVLNPTLVKFLRGRDDGASIADIADWVLTQERFCRLSVECFHTSLRMLVQAKNIEQKGASQRFFYIP